MLDFADREMIDALTYFMRDRGAVFRLGEKVVSVGYDEKQRVAASLESGKVVHAWACRGDADVAAVRSNEVKVKWQGRWITVPEVDRCEWFPLHVARDKINPAQADLIDRLVTILRESKG